MNIDMSHEYCFTNPLSQPDGSQAPSSLAQKSEPGTHVFLQELGKIQSATLTTERKMILLYERCLTPTKHCVYNNKANQIYCFTSAPFLFETCHLYCHEKEVDITLHVNEH